MDKGVKISQNTHNSVNVTVVPKVAVVSLLFRSIWSQRLLLLVLRSLSLLHDEFVLAFRAEPWVLMTVWLQTTDVQIAAAVLQTLALMVELWAFVTPIERVASFLAVLTLAIRVLPGVCLLFA